MHPEHMKMPDLRENPIEFFRAPPPEGRSRESQIALDRHGRFWDHGERFTHKGLEAAMHTWIRRHPDDGRLILCNGFDWSYFTVEDTPFFVVSLSAEGKQLWATLSDQSREPIDLRTLQESADERDQAPRITVKVKHGREEARLLRHAQLQLGECCTIDDRGELNLADG
jgi:uncharacterized protein